MTSTIQELRIDVYASGKMAVSHLRNHADAIQAWADANPSHVYAQMIQGAGELRRLADRLEKAADGLAQIDGLMTCTFCESIVAKDHDVTQCEIAWLNTK